MSFLPEPLRIPAFRAYWLSRLSTTIAQLAMVIVIGWQVYDIARDPNGLNMGLKQASFQLGLIGVVQFVPLMLLTLVTGWTADRIDRRWIARAAVALELFCAVALALLSWSGTTTLFALYSVAALLGVARAFAGPALGALAPNLVPRELLPKAIALSSISWQSGAILGTQPDRQVPAVRISLRHQSSRRPHRRQRQRRRRGPRGTLVRADPDQHQPSPPRGA